MPVHATAAHAQPTSSVAEATAWDDALLRRYDTSGPRYTSYPTALSFHDGFTADDMAQALERSNASQKATVALCPRPILPQDLLLLRVQQNRYEKYVAGRALPVSARS